MLNTKEGESKKAKGKSRMKSRFESVPEGDAFNSRSQARAHPNPERVELAASNTTLSGSAARRNVRFRWVHHRLLNSSPSGITSNHMLRVARGFIFPFCLFTFAFLSVGCRQDMHDQPKYEPLDKSAFFADGRTSRPLPEGTVARNQLRE